MSQKNLKRNLKRDFFFSRFSIVKSNKTVYFLIISKDGKVVGGTMAAKDNAA